MKSSTLIQQKLEQKPEITPYDLKEALDNYDRPYKDDPKWYFPHFSIVELRAYYIKLDPSKPLTPRQLYDVACILLPRRIGDYSKDVAEASKNLAHKMDIYFKYAHWINWNVFSRFIERPELYPIAKTIEHKLFESIGRPTSSETRVNDYDILNLIIKHPDAMQYIAKATRFTLTALNRTYLEIAERTNKYALLMPVALAIDSFAKIRNKFLPHVTHTVTDEKNYFIANHAENAQNIRIIFENLYFWICLQGKWDVEKLCEKIVMEMLTTSNENSPENLLKLKEATELLTKKGLIYIISPPYKAFVEVFFKPEHRAHSEQMALAAIELQRYAILDSRNVALIDKNPSIAYPICQILGLLKQAKLYEMRSLVYENSSHISQSVADAIKKLFDAKPEQLLTKDNAEKILTNLSDADSILKKLISSENAQEKMTMRYDKK